MLLRFAVTNFRSFAERQEIHMASGRGRRLSKHVIKNGRGRPGVLRCAAIYGANASGKSNLFKAIEISRHLIAPSSPAEVTLGDLKQFGLDRNYRSKPTTIEFEISLEGGDYAYGFSALNGEVVEEWCSRIDVDEILLFSRGIGGAKVEFRLGRLSGKDRDFLDFIARGMKPDRLLIRELSERQAYVQVAETSELKEIFDWFRSGLVTISPDSQYVGFKPPTEDEPEPLATYARVLSDLDTGVVGLSFEKQEVLEYSDLAEIIRNAAQKTKSGGNLVRSRQGDVVHVEVDDKKIESLSALNSVHVGRMNESVKFDWSEESDGTKRLLDLLPAILAQRSGDTTIVVDEVNRSLHAEVTLALVNSALMDCEGTRSQFIFTTHETALLDQRVLRRDEIWFVTKGRDGASSVESLAAYRLRNDKNLKADYFRGRFGGVPQVRQLRWREDVSATDSPAKR